VVKVCFEVHRGDEIIHDPEGAEFDDLAAAKKDAEAALPEMVGEDITTETPLVPRAIVILDDHHNPLATVQLKAEVSMVQKTSN
jgi:hypothetical protein